MYILPGNSSVGSLCIILFQQTSWTFVWLGEGESVDSKFENAIKYMVESK